MAFQGGLDGGLLHLLHGCFQVATQNEFGDELRRLGDRPDCSLNDVFRRTHEGDHSPVRRAARVHIEQLDAFNGLDLASDGVDDRLVAPLAEVRDALDDRHASSSPAPAGGRILRVGEGPKDQGCFFGPFLVLATSGKIQNEITENTPRKSAR